MPPIDELLAPIPGDDPAGPYLRHEPIYDQIKEARREDPDLPQGDWQTNRKTADWPLVAKLSADALAKRSKDLQLAVWWAEAALNREGIGGLRQGLELLRELQDRFWDRLHPMLDDGDAEMRAAPLAWLGLKLDTPVRLAPVNLRGHSLVDYRQSRTIPYEADAEGDTDRMTAREEALAEGRLSPEDFDRGFEETPKAWYKQLSADLAGCLDTLDALNRAGNERFGDVAPNYSVLRNALTEVRQVVQQLLARKLELDPDPPEPEPDATEQIALSGGADGSAGGEAAGPPKSREDAAARIAAVARYLRTETPTDPAPYLMLRGFRWGELRAQLPDVNPRLLAAPPTEVRTRLKGMLLDARWRDLLNAGEDIMASPFGRGWLDLQRYVLTACDALGSDFDAVGNAIRGALRALLQDLPQLPELTLMDDSATANRETREWLEAQGVMGADGGGSAVRPAEGLAEGARAPERPLAGLAGAQPQKAIELLMRAAAQERSERARFLRRSDAARIMVESGLETVAMPILQEMQEQIDRHQLEDWEPPDTVSQPLAMLYRCMERLGADSAAREALYLRVCRLDPMQAIHFANASNASADEQSGS